MSHFYDVMPWVFEDEGGYVDHPSDPGGATKWGITRKTLATSRGVKPYYKLPKSAVRSLTQEEATAIYKSKYWDKVEADHLPSGIAYAVFDYAVNSGDDRAERALQKAVGAYVDGEIGKDTIKAVNQFCSSRSEAELIKIYCKSRLSFMQSLKHWVTFARGWSKRVRRVEKRALELAGTQHIQEQDTQHSFEGNIVMKLFSGKKTLFTAGLMIAAGLAEAAGIDVPGVDSANAGMLIMEGLGFAFIRMGIRNDVGG